MQAATGTWDGPAPRGAPAHVAQRPTVAAPVRDQPTITLTGGFALPMAGIDTAGLSADDMRYDCIACNMHVIASAIHNHAGHTVRTSSKGGRTL